MMRNETDRGRRPAIVAIAAMLVLATALALAGTASAKTVYKWVYAGNYPENSFGINDAVPNDSPASDFGFRSLKADQASNSLYLPFTVREEYGKPLETRLYKASFAGHSSPWAAFEPNTWFPNAHVDREFAVDNSGGPTQGRIYTVSTLNGDEAVYSFLPSGAPNLSGAFPVPLSGRDSRGIAVDPEGDIWVEHFSFNAGLFGPTGFFEELDPEGHPTGSKIWAEASTPGSENFPEEMEFDSRGNLYYVTNNTLRAESGAEHGALLKYAPDGTRYRSSLDDLNGTEHVRVAVDRSDDDWFVTTVSGQVHQFDPEGGLVGSFGQAEGSYPGLGFPRGIAVDDETHTVFVLNSHFAETQKIDKFVRTEPISVPTAKTVKASITPTTATLRGIVNADGIDTTDCHFEWGATIKMTNTAPCAEGNVFTGASGDHAVHADISGLTKGREYFFRLVAKNSNNVLSRGIVSAFRASDPPIVEGASAANIDTGGAHLVADIIPNGSVTHFRFEYGTESGTYTESAPVHPPDNAIYDWTQTSPQHVDIPVSGLSPETTYHWRFVAENDAGSTTTPDQSFTTFAKDVEGDKCANAHVRQQTGTRLLFDCRAYELVSAANAGGYDVESDLNPGESPLVSSPQAAGRLLYSLHYGSVPGIAGSPTDFGHDPYVAVRNKDSGWTTEYVGLPADAMADPAPYGSPLLGFDSALSEFAFGGENICEPCFSDGSINIPLRIGNGGIVKGMAGTLSPPADPAGAVAKPLSADGKHFVFGSEVPFESGGNSGEVTLYDRALPKGPTQIVSTTPSGQTMKEEGGEIRELDISSDGSHILFGHLVDEEGGNRRWHLYMHLGTSAASVDVTPGASGGVLYAGMSADGTKVYFATRDKLVSADTDASADIYEAEVNGAGPAQLSLVSVNGTTPSNSDGCTPDEEWNTVAGGPDCSAVAFAGGAGVSASGSIYFLSPELLDGSSGEAGAPNVYLHQPGQATQFVATIDDGTIDNPAVLHALSQPETHSYGDFQVSAEGGFAIFGAARSLTGYPDGGHYLLYRFAAEEGGVLSCVSCPVTGITATADTTPPPYGLGLSDDGKVFFTTTEQLVLRDTNKKADAYEWEWNKEEGWPQGQQQLISDGVSPLDSSMLGVTADGTDAFFFTHEVLTPEDENGNAVKVYDARAKGGFDFLPAPKPCAASDECHGPGTEPPPPPNIDTVTGGGSGRGNVASPHCKKGQVARKGRCVKRRKHQRRHRRHKRHHRGAHNG